MAKLISATFESPSSTIVTGFTSIIAGCVSHVTPIGMCSPLSSIIHSPLRSFSAIEPPSDVVSVWSRRSRKSARGGVSSPPPAKSGQRCTSTALLSANGVGLKLVLEPCALVALVVVRRSVVVVVRVARVSVICCSVVVAVVVDGLNAVVSVVVVPVVVIAVVVAGL
jgi:hypothetical protein